jgi:hypothetical protein
LIQDPATFPSHFSTSYLPLLVKSLPSASRDRTALKEPSIPLLT